MNAQDSLVQRMSEDDARAVSTQMLYLAPGSTVNRRFVWPGHEVNTGENRSYDVIVRDGRGLEDYFTLDNHGFKIAHHPTSVTDFYNNEAIATSYTEEIAKLVKEETGADLVATTNWMVRTSAEIEERAQTPGDYQHIGGIQPVGGDVHVDFDTRSSERGAQMYFQKHFPDAPGFKRCVILSVWRAFSPAPQDWPLAVCDFNSVDDSEGFSNALVVVNQEPSRKEMYAPMAKEEDLVAAWIFLHNPGHRWWYFSNMSIDETLLFKFYDTDHSKAWRTPHVAFRDLSADKPNHRASIEYRVFAYFT